MTALVGNDCMQSKDFVNGLCNAAFGVDTSSSKIERAGSRDER